MSLSTHVLDTATGRPAAGMVVRLYEGEELLAEGRHNDEIAERLSISVNTVKFHVRCVYEQLGIRSRLEAARIVAAL